MDKVLVIAGPTGTGKSKLAVSLAKKFNGEIISGDSMQVYRKMDIGTAKVTEAEKEGVPHHLLDILPLSVPYDVQAFQKACRKAIADITARGKLPIIAGGTGLYLKAALYDYVFDPVPADVNRLHELEQLDSETLYQMLVHADAESAAVIHPNNRKRVIRALLIADSGKKKSEREKEQQHKPVYDVFWLGLEKPSTDEKLHRRIDQMMESGLEQEVRELFSDPKTWDYNSFQGIGYKEWKPYLQGEATLDEVKEKILIHTRQYARRQMTWFRRQVPMIWHKPEETETIEKEVETWIQTSEASC